MAEISLYWLPASCAIVPLIALEEIGAPFELRLVNKFAGRHLQPPYSELNPKGKVPTLTAGGLNLTENPAIQTYLARRFPKARLLPAGSPEVEAEALSILCWIASALHPAITRLRHPESASGDEAAFSPIRAAAASSLHDSFAIAERRLAGDEWLFGAWSIADAYLAWAWWRATLSGLDPSPFPALRAHRSRAAERPSAKRALDRQEAEIAAREKAGDFPPGALLARHPIVAPAT